MEVETINTDSNNLAEILSKAAPGEELIIESEVPEDYDGDEIEEIVEIIEEIEELEEPEISEQLEAPTPENHEIAEIINMESLKKQTRSHREKKAEKGTKIQQIVTYDVDEDWQDDDAEQEKRETSQSQEEVLRSNSETVNRNSNNPVPAREINTNDDWVNDDEPESILGYEDDVGFTKRGQNTNSHHEIVTNEENNLVYTVLGSKKQSSPKKQDHKDKHDAARYIKMEQLEESTIPVEGTIYYEGENMETLYVAQSVEDNEQYQYSNNDVGDQDWEGVEQEANEAEENQSQEQIFLHEDEDGQLYFKDDGGKLQPVYLTSDGNYAIADNSSDEQDSQDRTQGSESLRQPEGGAVITPEMEHNSGITTKTSLVPASTIQEIDNEDNTVTISLIISEDENGQKRTQVIIPTTDNLRCDLCNKTFKTSFQLLRHNRLKHAREEDLSTRTFPCDLCPKRYPDQNSLVRHRKSHTGDRPFQCLECQKSFVTSTALRRHLNLHNPSSKPLPCIYCGRRFLDKVSLAKHEQAHLAGEQRTHTCDVCHKAFLHASDLTLHKKNHDPERKFDCEVCGREFNRLNNLQRHMMVHQQQGVNEEVLACDVCGITYKFMSSLTRHMVTTHMNPEKLRQQAEEQRRKRENNYRRYMENRKMYESHQPSVYSNKRVFPHNVRVASDNDDETN